MSININPIETYVPTIYVNNSEPDLDETNLNHAEQALKRVTDAANAAILALESLDSAKIDAAKIVNNLLATDTSTVLSGPMGKALGDRLTAAENLLTRLNGEMAFQELINSFNLNNATERKLYRAGNSATIKTLQNLPLAVSSGEVIIIWLPSLPDNSYGCQLLIHTSGAIQNVYLRHKYGSTWAGWGSFTLS